MAFLSVVLWSSRVQCGAAATALTVLEETATIQDGQTHDFVFAAQSGVRYDVDVRVGAGGGTVRAGDAGRRNTEASCRCSGDTNAEGHGASCDAVPSYDEQDGSGCSITGCFWCYTAVGACSDGAELVALSPSRAGPDTQWSTLACAGVTAEVPLDGVTTTMLYVLPPGATDNSQAVATQNTVAADKGLGFTAAATGDFTARVQAYEGSGPVTLTATAVGTAEHRSPPLRADGRPHPLEVSC
eukprot:COSAG06_NODE_16184_length_1015_cov_10.889738_2_plen_241_part_01